MLGVSAATAVEQTVNGLSLGAMYALLALGFTLVYGILELINFAHFNVFMVGSFVGLMVLSGLGLHGQETMLTGLSLLGALLVAFVSAGLACGLLGVGIEFVCLRPLRGVRGPAAMITTIGVSFILFNGVMLSVGADPKNFPDPLAPLKFHLLGANFGLKQVMIWLIAPTLMAGLWMLVQRTKLGRAMRATAQDAEAARMMGVDADRVIMMAFFLGSALAGVSGVIFGLYHDQTNYQIGLNAGLRAFTAAVLGGIGNVPGAMLGGLLVGLIETWGGQLIGSAWADVIIFSLLVVVLVVRPAGLLGRVAPNKS